MHAGRELYRLMTGINNQYSETSWNCGCRCNERNRKMSGIALASHGPPSKPPAYQHDSRKTPPRTGLVTFQSSNACVHYKRNR